MSIKVGKWYKSPNEESKSLYHIKSINNYGNNRHVSYGFNKDGNWSSSTGRSLSDFIEATKEEVESRLTEEAIKRGFVLGAKISCLNETDYFETVEEYDVDYYLNAHPNKGIYWNEFCLSGCVIMKDGVWGKPVELASKEVDILSIGTPKGTFETWMQEEWKGYEVTSSETFYYLKSSHGDNFYKVLETVQVKNEYHDWREYVKYMQLGTKKIFHKPTDIFYKEFKKVEV